MAIKPEGVVVGSKYRWPFEATRDLEDLDLTSATVVITFYHPQAKLVKHYTFTAPTATIYFDNPVTTFTKPGIWELSWRVTLGAFLEETQPRSFQVYESLAGK